MNIQDLMIMVVLPTAVLSAILSGLAFYFVYKRRLVPYSKELAVLIGKEVEDGVARAIEKHLPNVEDRVKQGMINGVTEMAGSAPQITGDVIRNSLENFDLMKIMRGKRGKDWDPSR